LKGELQAYNENNEFGEDFRSRLLSFKRIFENKKTMENFDGEIFRTLIKEAYIERQTKPEIHYRTLSTLYLKRG
jgi:hypothetical protein